MTRRQKAVWTAAGTVVGLAVFAGLTFGILIKYQPSFYIQAQQLGKDQIETQAGLFRRECNATINDFTERRPEFQLRLTETQINAWMRSDEGARYMSRLPGEIRNVCVRFHDDHIIAAAMVEDGLLSGVVTIEMRAVPDGDSIRIGLRRIRRGALSMLDAGIRRLIHKAADRFPDWVAYEAETDTFVVRPLEKASFDEIEADRGHLIIEGRTGYPEQPEED